MLCLWTYTCARTVIRQDNLNAPQTSDAIYVQLRKADKTPGKTRAVASSVLSLRDIDSGRWLKPVWLNLYGAPRKDDADLAPLPVSLFSGDLKSPDATEMNDGKQAGSCFRGRLLLSGTLVRQQQGSEATTYPILESEEDCEAPLAVPFTLDARICVGINLPPNRQFQIRVKWGSYEKELTQPQPSGDGLATWNEDMHIAAKFTPDTFRECFLWLTLVSS